MASPTFGYGELFDKRRVVQARIVALIVCAAVLVALPGCRGCRKTPEQIRAEKEKEEAERLAREKREREKKKPDLEVGRLVSTPHEWGAKECPYKPGHWTTAELPAKANHFHIWGDLELTVVDRKGNPIGLLGMPYTTTGAREVGLPKGQPKTFQSVFYVPPAGRNAFVESRFRVRKGGRGVYEQMHINMKRMPSYQYHFVVLARWPQSYKYLERLDSVKYPLDLAMEWVEGETNLNYYRVHLLKGEKQATLPQHALFWTSIAYLLWDDAAPGALNLRQREALLDWLHWGGQLIVSGPNSLDALGNTFLGPYLPATSTGSRELTAADFDELNARWTLSARGLPGRELAPVEPWAGVEFDVHPRAREVPGTGGLLVERRVGRGRIVVSAFALDDPALTSWPSFDGLFNACLLRRPPRRFFEDGLESQVTWAGGDHHQFAPPALCKLRYFTRDTGTKTVLAPREDRSLFDSPVPLSGLTEDEARRVYGPDVGSWSDFNAVANAAREALTNAARIEVPDRMFVVWVVAVYLLVLVPANWLVFRSIGRVEWAWAAAPVIAIVYTLVVIRLAQLDIGFARSLTEVAVVETQDDYPRAHVTRYTALYTSLATAYDFRLDTPGAQVQPFPVGQTPEYRLLPGERRTRLQYRFGRNVRMDGFHVTSNSTGTIHSEQMVDLGGPIELGEVADGGAQVQNGTAFTLHEAGVVRRTESGDLQTAWVGTLPPGAADRLAFTRHRDDPADGLWQRQRSRSRLTEAAAVRRELNLRKLIELAEDPSRLQPGDVRLVGWFDEEIPGLAIKPGAPQSRRAALVVAHLRRGFGEDPRPDVNMRLKKKDDYHSIGPDGISALTE